MVCDMTFVITQGSCNDAVCVSVCPVQCIRPRQGDPEFTTTEQLYIDPRTCIDCGACYDVCPVEAIYRDYELPAHLSGYMQINEDYFTENPLGDTSLLPSTRRRLPDDNPELRVAIVGAGPSACYAADELSSIKGVQVSVFDRLPTPFGLVRAGVAPDHTATKLISDRFHSVLSRENVSCFFNVTVGTDITIEEIAAHHHAVIWAAGADDDRKLGIGGEDLPGSHSAREFVAWYNGHPDYAEATFDLTGERIVIVGNGNVALDVARALTRPVEVYEQTDMADHAIAALRNSAVREVQLVARRGQAYGAYSTAELLALSALDGVDLLAEPAEVTVTDSELAAIAPDGITRDLQRRFDVVNAAAARTPTPGNRIIRLRFRQTPAHIDGDDAVASITLNADDGSTETIDTRLVLRAIGYKARPVPGLPFDEHGAIIPNAAGRAVDPDTESIFAGLFCTGWAKRGATGIIGSNRTDSAETVASLLADHAAGVLPTPTGDADDLSALITARQPNVVDSAGWQRVDAAEKAAGQKGNRPRVKFISVDEMLAASRPA